MHIKLWILGILSLLALVFVVQNTEVVSVRFLFWKLEMSRALLLIGLLAAGFALGTLTTSLRGLRGHR